MLILFVLFGLFLWGLAKAPQAVMQGALALLWLTLAVGCAASILAAI